MNKTQFDYMFDDLKQFIEVTVSQSESRINSKIVKSEKRIIRRMDDGFGGIADIFDYVVNPKLDDYEDRIAVLENNGAVN